MQAAPTSASQLYSFAENAGTETSTHVNPRVFMDLQVLSDLPFSTYKTPADHPRRLLTTLFYPDRRAPGW